MLKSATYFTADSIPATSLPPNILRIRLIFYPHKTRMELLLLIPGFDSIGYLIIGIICIGIAAVGKRQEDSSRF
jgi:hypothetical protein